MRISGHEQHERARSRDRECVSISNGRALRICFGRDSRGDRLMPTLTTAQIKTASASQLTQFSQIAWDRLAWAKAHGTAEQIARAQAEIIAINNRRAEIPASLPKARIESEPVRYGRTNFNQASR